MMASLEKMREEYENVEKMIDQLDGNYNTVLVRKYLLCETADEIAKNMGCGVRSVWRWHDCAINKIIKDGTLWHTQT